mgnify:CR=1 FL=1
MSGRNGYFQIVHKDDGTYLKLIPAVNGGMPIIYDELNDYLYDSKIYEYDKIAVGKTLANLSGITEVKLNSITISPLDESMDIFIPEDRMHVRCRFYPPSEGGKLITKEDIVDTLVRSGVKYGLDELAILQFIEERKYCTDYIFAKALPPVEGRDATITYHFNTDISYKPKMNEDGTVDFHQLDLFSPCKKGDLLATLTPMDTGKPGIDVYGTVIRPTKVRNLALRHGKMIHISEDGLNLYSDVDGHVTLVDGRVFVHNTYEISTDVGASTGDIDYDGNVYIKGNVITGFSVKAKGNIEVNGVVEGAYIEAGGHVVLRRGIQGMNKGVIKAYGNIVSKFIENAEVIASGSISTETILHSRVSAKGDIIVSGRKGFVTGGEIRSGTLISVKTVGSSMGTNTVLEVGVDPQRTDQLRELEVRIEKMRQEREKIEQTISLFRKKMSSGVQVKKEQLELIKKVVQANLNLEKQLNDTVKQYEELKTEVEGNSQGKIEISDVVYPGTKIVISSAVYNVKDVIHHSRFVKDRADIVIHPL